MNRSMGVFTNIRIELFLIERQNKSLSMKIREKKVTFSRSQFQYQYAIIKLIAALTLKYEVKLFSSSIWRKAIAVRGCYWTFTWFNEFSAICHRYGMDRLKEQYNWFKKNLPIICWIRRELSAACRRPFNYQIISWIIISNKPIHVWWVMATTVKVTRSKNEKQQPKYFFP